LFQKVKGLLLTSWHSVFLHILLVGRCCFYIQRKDGSFKLGDRNLDEEEVLVALMERRRRLEEEAEARRSTADSRTVVTSQTVAAGVDRHEEQTQQVEEDLIDMEATDDEGP
jgi:hypothetical protein